MSLNATFFACIATISFVFGCKQTWTNYVIYPDQRNWMIVQPIPMFALDICLEAEFKINEYIAKSMIYVCNSTDSTIGIFYDDINCDGNIIGIYDIKDPPTAYSECNGEQCSDYATVRYYMDDSINETTDDINDCNFNSFIETALVVNSCIDTKQYIPYSGFTYHLSISCNESAIFLEAHHNNDCSDQGTIQEVWYYDDQCYNGIQIEIIYCTPKKQYNYYGLIFLILRLFIYPICLIINLWILKKLFSDLYGFERKYICSLPICCKIIFSDKHNWIIEPSNINKIYGIISSTLYATIPLISLIADFTVSGFYRFFATFVNLCVSMQLILDVLYMTSTLEYHMDDDGLIKEMVPKKFIRFLKVITVIATLLFIVIDFILLNGIGYSYIFYSDIIGFVIQILFRLATLYLYYRGLNNVCHYWYSKQYKEYDKYGENERTHEIIISITRGSVIILATVIAMFISQIFSLFTSYYSFYYQRWRTYQIVIMAKILVVITNYVTGIQFILGALTIYFIYPFSHIHYEKICGCCHNFMYQYFKKRHQQQVKNGAFDGKRYRIQELMQL